MNWKDWLTKKEGKRDWFGLAFSALLGLGVIFLVVSNTHISNGETSKSEEGSQVIAARTSYEEELASRLEEALGHMEGVGRVRVMITLNDGGEKYVLQDDDYTRSESEESFSSGQGRYTLEEQRQTETVRDAADQPYVLKEELPRIQGVLILAEGAGSSVVQRELLKAVQALLGVSAQKVHIALYQ